MSPVSRLTAVPARIATAAARHPLWVVLAWVLIAVGSLDLAATSLSINTDTEDLVSDELPFRRAAQTLKAEFPQRGSLLVLVVSGRVPEEVAISTARLAEALGRDATHFDSVFVPGMDPFFDRNALLYLDVDELEELAVRLARLQPFLGRIADRPTLDRLLETLVQALEEADEAVLASFAAPVESVAAALEGSLAGEADPLSWRRIVDGEAGDAAARRVVLVQARADYEEIYPFEAAIEAARAAGREVGLGAPGERLSLAITGANAVEHEDLLSVTRGAALAALAALVLVIATLALGLRSLRVVLAAVLTLLAGLALTVGFATVFVGHLNLVSVAFAVLYIGLGIDAAIHFAMRFQELNRQGVERLEALGTTATDIAPALTLCAATTAVGFYAFVPTPYSGVAELGLIGGTGMFVSLLAALTLLPALLRLLAPRPHRLAAGLPVPVPEGVVEWGWRRPRALGVVAGVATAVALVVALGVRFDYDPLKLSDPTNESVVTFRQLGGEDGRPAYTASALAPSRAEAGLLAARLEALGPVDSVTTLLDFVPEDQDSKLLAIDDMALTLGALPPARDATTEPGRARDAIARFRAAFAGAEPGAASESLARLGSALERLEGALDAAGAAGELLASTDRTLFSTLPFVLDRLAASLEAGPVTLEDVPEAIARRWVSGGGAWRLEIAPSGDLSAPAELRAFVDAVLEVAPGATDDPIEIQRVGQAIVSSFAQALLTALVAIGLLLLVVLRSPRDALVVLVPLVVGAAALNAVMALADIRYNFANIIALPLLLGIGVDNGVHVVRRVRDGAFDTAGALLRSSTSRAIVFSALTTIVSFGSLGLSAHPGTASMGWILTIGMVALVAATLLLLPPLAIRTAQLRRAG